MNHSRGRFVPSDRAFTLVEILVTMAIFSLVMAGIISGTVYGMRMSEITRSKVERSRDARAAMGKLSDEIRSARISWIGNVDGNGTFRAVVDGSSQTGSALILYPTTNRANYIVYFLNSADKTFRRTTSAAGPPVALAAMVTNSVIFRAQDYRGNILTNQQNNRVIHVNLEFVQPRTLSAAVEYFKLETAVTRRALD
ncbi:MAG TPA: prepilin-type N-terminal cleavage/methylation domain-containing protein [Methylomirabilota bacterium]|nr:prepilin-type N-terminal cleavage/methylation domain-containing protein [Methylomirabilota bacterium]